MAGCPLLVIGEQRRRLEGNQDTRRQAGLAPGHRYCVRAGI